MTTTEHQRGGDEPGRDERDRDGRDRDERDRDERGRAQHGREGDDRARGGDDSGGEGPALRSCRSRRPTRIDVVTGLALLGLVAALGLSLPGTIAASALATVTGALVRIDIAERRLPNGLVLAVLVGAAAGVVAAAAGGAAVPAAWACLLGLVVLAACVPLVHAGGLGAGDAKLASVGVVAASLASSSAPLVWLVAVAFFGGAHAAVAAAVRRRRGDAGRVSIPFGPVMLTGWWIAVVAAAVLESG